MTAATYPVTLYYDSACPLCDTEMHNLMLRNQAGQLRFEDVQAPRLYLPRGRDTRGAADTDARPHRQRPVAQRRARV